MSRLQPSARILYCATMLGVPLAERYRAAREAGFTAVSAFTSELAEAGRSLPSLGEMRAMIEAEGLALHMVEMIASWLPGQRADAPTLPPGLGQSLLSGTAEKVCAVARQLGARTVTAGDLFGLPFDGPMVARHFAALCDVAADHGLGVTLEFIPAGCIATVAQAREVLERADRANAGMIVDSWHFFRGGSSLNDLAATPPELIDSWQMNDTTLAPRADHIFADMTLRVMPGEGEFDLKGLMQALAATGTTAPGGIETFGPEMQDWPAERVARRSAEALDYCLDLSGEPA